MNYIWVVNIEGEKPRYARCATVAYDILYSYLKKYHSEEDLEELRDSFLEDMNDFYFDCVCSARREKVE